MFNLIDPAYAQSAGAAAGFDYMSLLPFAVIFVAFYFFLIRPQQKKAQEQRDMLNAIQRGDRVITAGGIIGVVDAVEENEAILKIEDGTKMRVIKSSIAERVTASNATVKKNDTPKDNVRPLNAKSKSKQTSTRRKSTATKIKKS